ncbi:unnamed protein product [Menidia menidia]|uniref:(Atlantic silverside) hypothetical protein n=1 Tax=Menidia menidia TaxID=238744 RepID=A0A8S4AP85_9TELE|nr:unnamed protein product [Menidia menidia]
MAVIFFVLLIFGVAVPAGAFNCGPLPGEVNNGDINYPDGTETGAVAKIECRLGYNLIGKGDIECGEQGWLERLPVCEPVRCTRVPDVDHATSDSDGKDVYDFSQTVTYTCNDGYTLDGPRQLSCSEDESFRPAPPKCVKVQCADLRVENGELVEGSRPPHGHRASLRFKCKKGFELVAGSSVTCDITSKWTPTIPQCRASGGGSSLSAGLGTVLSLAVLLVLQFWV